MCVCMCVCMYVHVYMYMYVFFVSFNSLLSILTLQLKYI